MKTLEMEVALATFFNSEEKIIVPNIWHSFFNYELDLLVLTKSRYAYEVEIKVSLGDLKRDIKKPHHHINPKIKYLYFAIPENLKKHADLIQKNAGILVVKKEKFQSWHDWNRLDYLIWEERLVVEEIRKPNRKSNYKFTDEEYLKLLKRGYSRIWTLKEQLLKEGV